MRTIIANGQIVYRDTIFRADLVVEDGIITEIRQAGYGSQRGKIIDATGLYVLPGAIDIHFHCRAPAYPERGDFTTETRAAAAGGVTTILEMPISKPGTSTAEVFNTRRELGEKSVHVDFGLYAAPASLDTVEISRMVEAGAIGFKTFMTAAPEGRDDEFEGLCATNEDEIFRILEITQPYKIPAVFHSENNRLLDLFESRFDNNGNFEPKLHALSRPPVVESTAIAMLLAMVRETQRGVHIAHLSTEAGLELIRDARRRGIPVTTETCPHHLLFNSEALGEAGPFAKINPPLRDFSDSQALWGGIEDGTIEVVTTDHSPFSMAEKERGWQDIRLAPPGVPSVEILYPFVLDQALRGRFSICRAVDLVSTRPATLYNLYPQKGVIQVGASADLVLFDPRAEHTVDHKQWISKSAACDRLYTGMVLRGRIHQTLLHGKVIAEHGKIIGQPGDGKFIRPGLRLEDQLCPGN